MTGSISQKPLPPSVKEHFKQSWENYRTQKKLKYTRKRELVIQEFFKQDKHISISELLAKVKKKDPSIGFVTVYRTLKLLIDANLAETRQFGDGHTRYEISSPTRPHHDHLICVECKAVLEFENEEIEALQKRIAENLGSFSILHHKLELYGLCPKAQGIKDGSCASDDKKINKLSRR